MYFNKQKTCNLLVQKICTHVCIVQHADRVCWLEHISAFNYRVCREKFSCYALRIIFMNQNKYQNIYDS